MAFVDGVAGRLLPSDLSCPRCPAGTALRGVEHEGFRADVCLRCHGAWFGVGVLEAAVRAASERPARRGEAGHGPAHAGMETVRYARCPRCSGGMARIPFCRKPLVIIDLCPSHGHWCDGGELGQLKAVARSRGVREALGGAVARPGAERARRLEAAFAADGTGDPLIDEIRRRPGNWGLVPPAVERNDALREGGGFRWGRRRRRYDLFQVLFDILLR
jgi:Zn-finger nucleic acid-binding protein